MSDLYREQLLDHARRPRNSGVLSDASAHEHGANPSCGDVIDVYVRVAPSGIVEVATFTGQGCVISQAAVSILLETLPGRAVTQILAMSPQDMVGLLGIEPGPMRMPCAMLGLRTVQQAITESGVQKAERI